MISWIDEQGTMHYTTFGVDHGKDLPYWVRYTDLDGKVIEKGFLKPPWLEGGAIEYGEWIHGLEQVEKVEAHGPSTFRP